MRAIDGVRVGWISREQERRDFYRTEVGDGQGCSPCPYRQVLVWVRTDTPHPALNASRMSPD